MSIAALRGKNFKHTFQDDMESFYYVILYSSVLWLPHKEVHNLELHVSKFFDEYSEDRGKVTGGIGKISDRAMGTFYEVWEFKNDSLKCWLEEVRTLQEACRRGAQPKWTPEALHRQWKMTDEDNLPVDDRIDHRLAKLTEHMREEKPNIRDAATIASVSCSSSKRSTKEASFDERSDSNKRHRGSSRLGDLKDDK